MWSRDEPRVDLREYARITRNDIYAVSRESRYIISRRRSRITVVVTVVVVSVVPVNEMPSNLYGCDVNAGRKVRDGAAPRRTVGRRVLYLSRDRCRRLSFRVLHLPLCFAREGEYFT